MTSKPIAGKVFIDAAYTPTLRAGVPPQMVDLVREERDPTDLAREFEPSAQVVRNWVAAADRQSGRKTEPHPTAC